MPDAAIPRQADLVSLRQAVPGDAHELAELRVLAMRQSLEAVGRYDPERARSRFLDAFVPAETHHILQAGKSVGFVVVRAHGKGLLLDHLCLHPQAQGQGIGTAVVKRLQAEAGARGQSVHVGALKGSRSNDFYQRHGFRLIAESEWDHYYVWPGGGDA